MNESFVLFFSLSSCQRCKHSEKRTFVMQKARRWGSALLATRSTLGVVFCNGKKSSILLSKHQYFENWSVPSLPEITHELWLTFFKIVFKASIVGKIK